MSLKKRKERVGLSLTEKLRNKKGYDKLLRLRGFSPFRK